MDILKTDEKFRNYIKTSTCKIPHWQYSVRDLIPCVVTLTE